MLQDMEQEKTKKNDDKPFIYVGESDDWSDQAFKHAKAARELAEKVDSSELVDLLDQLVQDLDKGKRQKYESDRTISQLIKKAKLPDPDSSNSRKHKIVPENQVVPNVKEENVYVYYATMEPLVVDYRRDSVVRLYFGRRASEIQLWVHRTLLPVLTLAYYAGLVSIPLNMFFDSFVTRMLGLFLLISPLNLWMMCNVPLLKRLFRSFYVIYLGANFCFLLFYLYCLSHRLFWPYFCASTAIPLAIVSESLPPVVRKPFVRRLMAPAILVTGILGFGLLFDWFNVDDVYVGFKQVQVSAKGQCYGCVLNLILFFSKDLFGSFQGNIPPIFKIRPDLACVKLPKSKVAKVTKKKLTFRDIAGSATGFQVIN